MYNILINSTLATEKKNYFCGTINLIKVLGVVSFGLMKLTLSQYVARVGCFSGFKCNDNPEYSQRHDAVWARLYEFAQKRPNSAIGKGMYGNNLNMPERVFM